jgi:OmcA/MtrC family decaheme c-type cytochrome
MRIPSSVFTVGRYLIAVVLVVGACALIGAPAKTKLTPHDKAFYADPALVEYVQPGFTISVVSAKIATNGTVSVDYKLADPNGQPLDLAGVVTPGPISVSFLIAYIPKGQAQFASYITRTVAAATGPATATQASGDSGGTTTTVATGEYIYTYKTVLPANYDQTATHRVGLYGSRNLTVWDLGTDYADTWYDWVPNGSTPAPRDVVRTPDCNTCHGSAATVTGSNGLAAHGGSRRDVEVCIICHQPQTSDPNTGNSLDMKVFIHSIHMGSSLPTVAAGKPYQIIGFQNSVNDFSTVVYPADVRRCQTCHNPKNGAAQTGVWLTTPGALACGGCHNNINFPTGLNHAGGPQPDDSMCAGCHIPQGELEFDASIIGAHVIPDQSKQIAGINIAFVKVTLANGTAGMTPTVTFTVRDNSGNGIPMSTFISESGTLSLTMTGPTNGVTMTNFGADSTTPGYVTESATGSTCTADGTCTYTFTHPVPPGSKGTYMIGAEARLTATLNPGDTNQQTTNYGAVNQVTYFSVDGSPVAPRRTVVAMANCNACHVYLEEHGDLRNNVTYCVICHNPENTDFTTRPSSTTPALASAPPQAINFALMVHKLHTGLNLEANFNQDYIVVGHGGSTNDFGAAFTSVPASIPNTGVRFPAMGPTGAVQDTAQCYMCHANGSEAVFPEGLHAVTDPQGLLNPAPATTSACTACHLNLSAMAHAVSQTDPKFGESCDVCHAAGAAYDVTQVHAGK